MSIFHAQRAAKRYARQIAVTRKRLAAYPNSARSTLSDRGWQQPLDHPTAQPARRVKDAEGTAQPLVLDSVRWLGYLAIVRQRHAITIPPKLLLKVKPSKKKKIFPISSIKKKAAPARTRPSQSPTNHFIR